MRRLTLLLLIIAGCSGPDARFFPEERRYVYWWPADCIDCATQVTFCPDGTADLVHGDAGSSGTYRVDRFGGTATVTFRGHGSGNETFRLSAAQDTLYASDGSAFSRQMPPLSHCTAR